MSDPKLTDFLSGDKAVLEELYKNDYPKVKSFVLRNSGTVLDAQDIFQDAVVLTYQKLKSGSLNLKCSLATYIFAVSRNMWMNVLRRQKKILAWDVEPDISDDLQNDIFDEIENRQREMIYQKYFLKLGKDCQEILRHFFNDKSMKEIAALMNFSIGYTRKKKFKCKKRLIEMLEADSLFQELSSDSIKDNEL